MISNLRWCFVVIVVFLTLRLFFTIKNIILEYLLLEKIKNPFQMISLRVIEKTGSITSDSEAFTARRSA